VSLPPGDDAKEKVRGYFESHAAHYARDRSQKSGPDLVMLLERLETRPADVALDVGTAAGNTAAAIAPRVASVTGLDLTPAMKAQFDAVVAAAGARNVRFEAGDVEALPYPDASFDLVTCRRAVHHFPDPPRAMAEMARVLRPGGRAGFTDMATPENPDAAALFNDLERARDASHQRTLPPTEWRRIVEGAGLEVLTFDVFLDRTPWERWISPVSTGGPEDALAGRRLAAAAPAARGLVVEGDGDGRVFLKWRVVVTARRPG
jgi:ubiquinone/menaquinone biosynthesis C-methylase UbiE